ncbi:MAG: hydrolase [Nitrososphaerota archaeon]
MSETSKDELIAAQNQVIGILFEIIKRLQANNDLDEEYFQIIENNKRPINKKRLDEIMQERTENTKIVTALLKKLEV